MIFNKLILFVVVFLSLNSHAKNFKTSIELLKVTSDADQLIKFIKIYLDKNEFLKSMDLITIDPELKNKVVEKESFSFDQVTKGVVLLRDSSGKRKVIIGKCENCDKKFGGLFDLNFLYNGITKNRNHYYLDIKKVKDSWALTLPRKEVKIDHLHMISNRKRLLGIVGIKRIEIVD